VVRTWPRRFCSPPEGQSSESLALFIKQVREKHSAIAVGDIEPYPYFSISELEQWIAALEAKGATPAFFHLDVDREAARVGGQNVAADLQELNRRLWTVSQRDEGAR
jgi:hypothetical protein